MDIVNLCLTPLCLQLEGIAAARGLNFSMWVDDLSFSGPRADEAISEITACITKNGLSVKRRKTEVMHNTNLQTVAGIRVNKPKPSATRRTIDELFDTILFSSEAGFISEELRKSLKGKVDWIRRLSPAAASRAQIFLDEIPRTD